VAKTRMVPVTRILAQASGYSNRAGGREVKR
jgi:hypothetical protein